MPIDPQKPPSVREQIDGMIQANRAERLVTPPNPEAAKRTAVRSSIQELNASDMDQIRDRMAATHRASRTPTEAVLDALDWSRNTAQYAVTSIVAPSLIDKLRGEQRIKDGSVPQINGSDILEHMGIENRVLRGLAGFGVDVFTDPLTLIGPGAVAKVGRATIQRSGVKQLTRAVNAVAKGRPIADDLTRALVEVSVKDKTLARLRPMLERTGGKVEGRMKDLVRKRVERTIDSALEHPDAVSDIPSVNAAREWMRAHGRGVSGYKIGKGGSQIAHVPWTDINLQVPAFTSPGRTTLAQNAMVKDNVTGLINAAGLLDDLPNLMAKAGPVAASSAIQLAQPVQKPYRVSNFVDDLTDLRNLVGAEVADPTAVREAVAKSQELLGRINSFVRNPPKNGVTLTSEEALALGSARREAITLAESMSARLNKWQAGKMLKDAKLTAAEAANLDPFSQSALRLVHRLDAIPAGLLDETAEVVDDATLKTKWGEYKTKITEAVQERFGDGAAKKVGEAFEKPGAFEEARQAEVNAIHARKQRRAAGLDTDEAIKNARESEEELFGQWIKSQKETISGYSKLAQMYESGISTMLGGDERALVDVAKHALQSGDEVVGISSLLSMRDSLLNAGESTSARRVAANAMDAIDRQLSRIHKSSPGTYAKTVRRYNIAHEGATASVKAMEQTLANRLRSLAKSPKDMDALSTALALKVMNAVDPSGRYALNYRGLGVNWGKKLKAGVGDKVLEARAAAILSDSETNTALNELADVIANQYRTLQGRGLQSGTLDGVRPAYMAQPATQEFRSAIRRQQGRVGAVGTSGASAKEATPDFNFERTSNLHEWVDPDGREAWFYDYQRPLADMDDKQLSALFPTEEGFAQAKQLVDDIKAHDVAATAGDDALAALGVKSHQIDPWTMNQLEQSGAFAYLTGGPIQSSAKAFEVDPISALINRMHSQELSEAKQGFAKVIATTGLRMDKGAIARHAAKGEHVIESQGVKFYILPDGGAQGIRVAVGGPGGPVYRSLSTAATKHLENPLVALMGESAMDTLVPEVLARKIEDVLSVDPVNVLRDFTQISNLWRTQVLMHPSWIVNNGFGNILNLLATGINILKNPIDTAKSSREAFRLIRAVRSRNPEAIKSLGYITIGGRTRKATDVVKDLLDEGVWGAGRSEFEQALMADAGLIRFPSSQRATIQDTLGTLPARAGQAAASVPADATYAYRSLRNAGSSVPGAGFKAGQAVFTDRLMRSLVSPWFKANGLMEDWFRFMAFDAALKDGNDAAAAAARVREALFDYSDLSKVERHQIKPMVPFMAWLKNNGLLQMKLLFRRPAVAAAFPKIQEAVEEALDGEARVPTNMRPRWMRQELGMQIGSNPETRQMVLAGASVPQADIYRWIAGVTGEEGFQDLMHYFASNLSPAITAPLQMATGREWFSDRSIGDPDVADIGRGEFVAKQFRLLSELGVGSRSGGPLTRAFEQGVGPGIGRLALGGKFQDASDERLSRQLLRDFTERAQALRRNITRSENAGNKGESLRLRVELLRTYREMSEAGLEAETPAWSRKQLAELGV